MPISNTGSNSGLKKTKSSSQKKASISKSQQRIQTTASSSPKCQSPNLPAKRSVSQESMNVVNQAGQLQQQQSVLNSYDLTNDDLIEIKSKLKKELELGLSDEDSASVKMLLTYVRELTRGDEHGYYLSLDLGGTNFRVLLVKLVNGKATIAGCTQSVIPMELQRTENGQDLFDYIALKLLEFVKANKLKRRRISLGFTFSFPCKQYGLTQSILVKWCKGFNVGGVVGTDIVKQLKNALKRQLSGLVEAYIDVVAVINDTTGTLVACANVNQDCRIGLIVGTGYNACYMEKLNECEKWPANYTNPKQVIVNCEWGAFGDDRTQRPLDKYRNEFDLLIDQQSINPNGQTYEKMVSGMYIGEMLRLTMLKFVQMKCLFNGKSSKQLETKDTLNGKHLSLIADDEKKCQTHETMKILNELALDQYVTKQDLQLIIQISRKIIQRSASLVAAGVSVLLERMKRQNTTVGFDGSVIRHHPYFLDCVIKKCQELTNPNYKFQFNLSTDGSGIGAAVVAAALHKERRPLYIVKNGKVYEMHFSSAQPESDII